MKRLTILLCSLLMAALPLLAHGGELDDYYLKSFAGANGGDTTLAGAILQAEPSSIGAHCGTPLRRGLSRDWNKLATATQAVLAKYVAKPTLSGPEEVPYLSPHFRINYTRSGTDAPPLTDANGNGTPDWVESVAAIFEEVYAAEVTIMGYKAPPTGGAPYDVYLQDLAARREFGFTEAIAPPQGTVSVISDIVIDNNFTDQVYAPFTGLTGLQITAAHEFHHAIQYGYNFFFDIWYAEATSTWIEDEVYDSVNQLYNYLPAFLQRTSLSIDTAVDVTTGGGYGRWLYNRFLSETYTPTIIRSFWEQLATISSPSGTDIPMIPVMDAILQGKATTVGSSYFDFSRRLYKRDWQSHASEIPLIYQHPIVPIASYSDYPLAAASAPILTLNHYASAFIKFTPSATAPANLTLNFSAKPTTLSITGFKKSADGSIQEFPFNTAASTLTVSGFNSATTTEAMVIVTNTSATNNQSIAYATDGNSPAVPPADLPPTTPPTSPPPTTTTTPASSDGGGCFIATAAYGSYLHPKVQVLREFRDRYLLTNATGRQLVALYYRFSPPLAATIARHDGLRTAVRVILAPAIFVVEHGGGTIATLTLAAILMGGTVARRRRPVR